MPAAADPGSACADAVRTVDGHVRIAIRAKPRAKQEGIDASDTELVVRVRAPPVDGAANERVIEVMAGVLAIAKRNVAIVRGESAAHKELEVRGLSRADVIARLVAALAA